MKNRIFTAIMIQDGIIEKISSSQKRDVAEQRVLDWAKIDGLEAETFDSLMEIQQDSEDGREYFVQENELEFLMQKIEPDLKEIKEIELLLEEAKSSYKEFQGKRIRAEILQDSEAPVFLKDLIISKDVATVQIRTHVLSEDYMPTPGSLIEFEEIETFIVLSCREFAEEYGEGISTVSLLANHYDISNEEAEKVFTYLETLFTRESISFEI